MYGVPLDLHVHGGPKCGPFEAMSTVYRKSDENFRKMSRHLRNGAEQVLNGKIGDDDLILLDGGHAACRLRAHGGRGCRLRAFCHPQQ